MSTQGHFRSAVNGFHRADVVDYIETQALLHKKETNQLENSLIQSRNEAETQRIARIDAVKQCYYELEEQKSIREDGLQICTQMADLLSALPAESSKELTENLAKLRNLLGK